MTLHTLTADGSAVAVPLAITTVPAWLAPFTLTP